MKLRNYCAVALAIWAGALAPSLYAEPSTALGLIPEGNRYVGEQSKDRVVEIRSEKSVGSLAPAVWYVVYYDPTATLKATEVKFGAGKMIDVKRPMRLLEPIRHDDRPLDRAKVKIDSDRALAISLKEPMLKNITLKATQFWLEHGDLGPQWRVRLWAAKLSNPERMADIGQLFIDAGSGEVFKNDLHLNRVD